MELSQIVILVYAVLMMVGGFLGYRLRMSKISLISGMGSGGLLLIALGWSFSDLRQGTWVAVVIGVLLSLVFLLRVKKTRKIMPSGMLLVLSVAVSALLVYSLLAGTST